MKMNWPDVQLYRRGIAVIVSSCFTVDILLFQLPVPWRRFLFGLQLDHKELLSPIRLALTINDFSELSYINKLNILQNRHRGIKNPTFLAQNSFLLWIAWSFNRHDLNSATLKIAFSRASIFKFSGVKAFPGFSDSVFNIQIFDFMLDSFFSLFLSSTNDIIRSLIFFRY